MTYAPSSRKERPIEQVHGRDGPEHDEATSGLNLTLRDGRIDDGCIPRGDNVAHWG